jgi:hypothetical protein
MAMKPKKIMNVNRPENFGGGSYSAKGIVRNDGGITGKAGKNVQPPYRETGNSVKVIKPGTKPLTKPTEPNFTPGKRSQADIMRMRSN